MKKKILLSLLCGVMVLGITTGCGNKENNNGDNNSTNNPSVENNNNDSTTNSEITIDSVKNAKVTDASKFDYREVEGGIAITDYEGTDEVVVVPETIDGQTVVAIDEDAFVNNDTIKGLKIANTVHTIGDSACLNCKELKVFVSGSSVKTIERYAFGNTGLEVIELNDGLETLEMSSFGFSYLKEVEIPSSVINITSPFLVDEVRNNGSITIIGEVGSAAEKYVQEKGEEYHLVFQAK